MTGAVLVPDGIADLLADAFAAAGSGWRWQDDALCAQVGDDFWFPDKGGSTREAKGVCGRCPVRAECLEYALANDERFGVWGGMSERERRRLRRTSDDDSPPYRPWPYRPAAGHEPDEDPGREHERPAEAS